MFEYIQNELRNIEYDFNDKLFFSEKGYTACRLDEKNYHTFDEKGKRICFIDGGNQEIIGGYDFSLQLIRCAYVIFENKKRIKQHVEDFYLFIKSYFNEEKKNIFFNAKIFGLSDIDTQDLDLNSLDETMKEGNTRFRPQKIGDMARKFSELLIAKKSIKHLKAGDILVLDGTLQSIITNEGKYREILNQEVENKGIVLVGFAKTSRLYTEKGREIISILNKKSRELNLKKWYYYPLCEINNKDHNVEIVIGKLHENAPYSFRIEINQFNKDKIESTIAALSEISNDYSFPGYPYGLIVADQLARVQNHEISALKTKFDMSYHDRLSGKMNPHDLLDTM